MLKGKVAIITGASSGIGQATAVALSKAGAKVAIGARRTDRLESLKSELEKNGGEVFVQKLDVTKKAECDSFVDAVIKKWGTVDILVNNAGLMPLSFFINFKISEWDQMIDVNIKGVLYCTAAVIPHLYAKKAGHIVNIASLAAFVESAKKMEALQSQDIANAILYAVDSPPHVNVNEILIRPTTQER